MEKEERALQYATNISESLIRDAIKQAYLQGFEDGINSIKKIEKENCEIIELTGSKYCDISLPSGILWRLNPKCNEWGYRTDIDNVLRYAYKDASKYNIPSEEQFIELLNNSKIERSHNKNNDLSSIQIITPGGDIIHLRHYLRTIDNSKYCFKSWLRSTASNNEAKIMYFDDEVAEIRTEFTGSKLPIWGTKLND